jgi:hypothetical protein
LRALVAVICGVGVCVSGLAFPTQAPAWSNGPSGANGFGTHDWVLQEAARVAARNGAGWVRLKAALPHTDDPDTVFHDYYSHVYDEWGGRYGDAPRKVAEYYGRALRSLRAGNRRRASVMIGIMAHYYADVCNPLHTDQCDAEERIHSAYETAVQDLTDAPGEHRGWLRPRPPRRVASARAIAVTAARAGHRSYRTLVRAFSAHGMNRTVLRITRASLNRAVWGLRDLIVSLK